MHRITFNVISLFLGISNPTFGYHPSGLSALVEEENTRIVAKSKLKGIRSSPGVKPVSFKNIRHGKVSPHNVTSIPEAEEAPYQISPVMRKRRQKPSPSKVRNFVTKADAIFLYYFTC